MRKHLENLHLRLGSDHIAKAKHHAALAEHYGQIAESFGKSEMADTHKDASECLQKIADAHKAMGEHHTTEADYHVKCAKALHDGTSRKAMGMNDGDDDELAPLPAGFSRVTADLPANIRAVPRHGAREIPMTPADVVSKIIGVGTDEGD
jgi:hypothetical protein